MLITVLKNSMLGRYLCAYLRKQSGKNLSAICVDFATRLMSGVIFPFIYITLSAIALVRPIRFGFLYHERLGHLALNTDLYLRRRYLGYLNDNEIHIFLVYEPANQQLVKMFAREMIVVNSTLLAKLLAPIGILRTRFWVPLPFLGNEFNEFNAAPPQIHFTSEEHLRGNSFLSELGLAKDDWYACIFARDHHYYKVYAPNTNTSFSDHRNADIETYDLAIKAILDEGGWVIRMGSCVEKPLRFEHPRVIDYATTCRQDFTDIYVTAHAHLFIGTTSGASDIAVLFDVPFVGVNYAPVGAAPFGKSSIYIPKRIVYKDTGEQVPMRQQLNAFIGNQVSTEMIPEKILEENGWRFVDNTRYEIRDVVEEQLKRINGAFIPDEAYKQAACNYQLIMPNENIYQVNRSPMGRNMLLSLDLRKD